MKGQLNASKCFLYSVYSVLEKDKGAQQRAPAQNNIAWTVHQADDEGPAECQQVFLV